MRLPEDILDRSPEEAARRIALGFLEQARAACGRLSDASDREALHDFRVALRRLRSTARAWKPELAGAVRKKDRERLGELLEETGAGRDAEVLLAWVAPQAREIGEAHRAGVDWMVDHLRALETRGYEGARDDVRRRFERLDERLSRRLDRLRLELRLSDPAPPPTFGERLVDRLHAQAHELSKHLHAVRTIDDQEEAHRARIAGKRLRYLIEPVKPVVEGARDVVQSCKRLQDVLGEMHDTVVLLGELGAAIARAPAERAPGLEELRRRAQERMALLFAELERNWIGGGGAGFEGRIRALADEIAARARGHREIERKYLLSGLPQEARAHPVVDIEQGYLPGRDLRERIRRVRHAGGVDHKRTVKAGRGIERIEVDEATTAEVFEAMWPLTEGQRVLKRRYEVPADEDGLVWELDEFTDRELYLAEIELPRADHPVGIPEWLRPYVVREVTDEPGYVNLRLAK